MKKIKVLLANTIPATFWSFTRGQITFLKEKGFEVIAVTSPGNKLEEFREREGIKVYEVLMTREISPFRDLAALVKIAWIMIVERPDIVHGSTPKAGFLTMAASVLAVVPAKLFFLRGLRHTEMTGVKRSAVRLMEKLSCIFADRVLCVSRSLMELVIEGNLVSREKSGVMHNGMSNGVDNNRFDPSLFSDEDIKNLKIKYDVPEHARALLFVGRLARDKGLIELARAWHILMNGNDDLYLLLAGRTETSEPELIKIMELLSKDDRVRVLGQVEDVVPVYAIADILVHPTYREGFPNSPMEASAMEIPVVATRVTGCVDAVVDHETGILVPPKDPEALAEAIGYLLQRPEERSRMGKAGRERVLRDFCQMDIWEALYREYARLLIEKGVIKSEEEIRARARDEQANAAKA
jgi:glycosyltransferase involved in cell wall biosynthesis